MKICPIAIPEISSRVCNVDDIQTTLFWQSW
jgi:hypothetical protein